MTSIACAVAEIFYMHSWGSFFASKEADEVFGKMYGLF
jgi:hypothetical protein